MILQRIKEYIDVKGISVSAFEKSIGMSNASFGRSLKNNGAIGTDKLENILSIYQDINPIWLLNGKGYMICNIISTTEPSARVDNSIPLISYSNITKFFSGKRMLVSTETKFFYIPLFKEADFLLTIVDSTMMPHYKAGDIVACKRLPNEDLFFQWNKIYLLVTAQGVLIKRIHQSEDNKQLLLVSDNPEFLPFQIFRSQIDYTALVLGSISVE